MAEWAKFDIRDQVFLPVFFAKIDSEGMPQPGNVTPPPIPSPSTPPPVDPPVDPVNPTYTLVGRIVSRAEHSSQAYVNILCRMVKEDGTLIKYMNGKEIQVHWNGANSPSDIIHLISGPHAGYPDWPPGGAVFTPAQYDGDWIMLIDDPVRGIKSNELRIVLNSALGHLADVVFEWTEHPVADYANLAAAVKGEAEKADVLAVNPAAAFCKKGAALGLWPTSNEFDFTYDSVLYRGQRFRNPLNDAVHVFYSKVGDWGNIKHVTW